MNNKKNKIKYGSRRACPDVSGSLACVNKNEMNKSQKILVGQTFLSVRINEQYIINYN